MNLTRLYEPDRMRDTLRIDDAQPVEWINPEMLDEISSGAADPWATIGGDQLDVVTFTDDYGHRYVYRLGEYDPLQDAYQMELID